MLLPLYLRRDAHTTLQSQIYEQLRSLILGGKLRPGQPIPGSRSLAEVLRVSRNTVLLAYERLASEGYIESRSGANTFVSPELPDAAIHSNARPPAVGATSAGVSKRTRIVLDACAERLGASHQPPAAIDFVVGRPDPHTFPYRTWRRHILHALDGCRSALSQYADPAGFRPLREAIAVHLGAARGISTNADQIVITEGIQEALNVVARLFVRRATAIAVENPCYRGLASVFRTYGATLVPMPVDEHGLEVDRLPRSAVSLVCVTPSHQFPTGYTMTLERRLRLLEWAAKKGVYVVEDDYDSDFRYDGPPLTALAGLDAREQVIYLGTFSKSIGASLRIGYLVLPRELVAHAVAVKSILDAGRSSLEQAALAEFIAQGDFARHLRRIRTTYRRRRDCLMTALQDTFGDVDVSGSSGGMHVMWHLPRGFPTAAALETEALKRGIGIYSLRSGVSFNVAKNRYSKRSLVIGYPAMPEQRIELGVAGIREAVGRLGVG